MKKVLVFLEAHVQWLALAMGALFLLWTAYAYVFTTPVMVAGVGAAPLSPGEVDKVINDGVASRLEGKIKDNTRLVIPTPELVADFGKAMNGAGLATGRITNFPHHIDGAIVQGPDDKTVPKDEGDQLVDHLPNFAAPVSIAASHGRSYVSPLVAAVAAAPAPAAGAPGAIPVGGVDRTWASVGFKIVMTEIAAAMTEARIPATLFYTSVMRVELHREEKLADGTWGNPAVVKALDTQNLSEVPAANDTAAKDAYIVWAESHVVDIVQPPFYQVLQGDQWKAPIEGMQVAAAAEAPAAFDANLYVDALPAVINRLTPEQRRAVYVARQKKIASERKPPTPQPGRTPRGGATPAEPPIPGAGRIGGYSTPYAPQGSVSPRPTDSYQAPPMPGRPTPAEAPPVPEPGMLPGEGEPGVTRQPATAGQFPLPAGAFNPRQTGDIVGWAHDVSVQPGKTYRYQVVYLMKNPIFKTGNVAKSPALANELMVASKKSDWSTDVTIPATIRFFMAANPGRNDTVRFEVFAWSNGTWHNKTFEVAPGDSIGMSDGTTDFTTGWVLADIRIDPRNVDDRLAMVTDSSGTLEARDYRNDNENQDRKTLKDQISTATAAASPTGAGVSAGAGSLGLK